MEKLVIERKRITDDPANANPEFNGLFLYNQQTHKKIEHIDRLITHKLAEKKIARGEKINVAGYSGRQTNHKR